MDMIGSKMMIDDDLVEIKNQTLLTYLQSVGTVLHDDYKEMSSRHHIGSTELIFETSSISYYMMYIDPCYTKDETVKAMSANTNINELASILSPQCFGVFGHACLIAVKTDLNGVESLSNFGRQELAMVLSKRLNHTAIKVKDHNLVSH